jgi:RNA polymerase sigma factor (sigma-70 family)
MSRPRSRDVERSFNDLASAARSGDEAAWRELCLRLRNVVWKVVNGFGLNRHDADDAMAATFFRLAEHLGDVRDPEKLPGWVARVATNEVYALLRLRMRTEPSADVGDNLVDPVELDDALIRSDLHAAVVRALRRLPERCQQLLRLLSADPRPSYAEIEDLLAVPHGTIGPTRRRCLDQLRRTPEMQPFVGGMA